jgi:hypothetical protein
MARASFLIEATAKKGRALVNSAAHVDLWIRKRRGSTSSTIAWITLRVLPRIHKPAATIFAGRSTSKTGLREEFTFQL